MGDPDIDPKILTMYIPKMVPIVSRIFQVFLGLKFP